MTCLICKNDVTTYKYTSIDDGYIKNEVIYLSCMIDGMDEIIDNYATITDVDNELNIKTFINGSVLFMTIIDGKFIIRLNNKIKTANQVKLYLRNILKQNKQPCDEDKYKITYVPNYNEHKC